MKSKMTLDEIVVMRNESFAEKDFIKSDRLRSILDDNLIFVYDFSDGTHEVYYLTEKYFTGMGPQFKTKRNYHEHRMQQDKAAEDLLASWLASMWSSINWSRQKLINKIKWAKN